MSESELREYFDIINECWKMLKNHANPVDDEEFWDGLLEEHERIDEKYKGPRGEFTKALSMLVQNEIEKVHRATWRPS